MRNPIKRSIYAEGLAQDPHPRAALHPRVREIRSLGDEGAWVPPLSPSLHSKKRPQCVAGPCGTAVGTTVCALIVADDDDAASSGVWTHLAPESLLQPTPVRPSPDGSTQPRPVPPLAPETLTPPSSPPAMPPIATANEPSSHRDPAASSNPTPPSILMDQIRQIYAFQSSPRCAFAFSPVNAHQTHILPTSTLRVSNPRPPLALAFYTANACCRVQSNTLPLLRCRGRARMSRSVAPHPV
ncbi:hypothetical protein BDK51DRAFT_52424 [Blyttiomyces helicus]|uniref:Uncharacterized protein n=1 Tax=Blyttiomyces helicus TaxID=388810 RepID=A0A4V1IRK1_9FUNG|nr:hypothetical protein BDK51DRAFT_52424 [Blyttiomyces helicus]|eukprot:RKO90337.1 hypothetical protein BDK51DRAFT_52424 [Blyttiomyces helicus]